MDKEKCLNLLGMILGMIWLSWKTMGVPQIAADKLGAHMLCGEFFQESRVCLSVFRRMFQ